MRIIIIYFTFFCFFPIYIKIIFNSEKYIKTIKCLNLVGGIDISLGMKGYFKLRLKYQKKNKNRKKKIKYMKNIKRKNKKNINI